MLRTPLQQGDSIQLNNQQYTIDAPIGYGATCIVYSAYYSDGIGHRHHINLKECYPHNAAVSREQKCLTWKVESEQENALASFRNTYDKLMSWQNENFAVSVFDLCEGNNTLYIVMNADKGITFDKDNPASLNDILKTAKLLTHFVGKYHENGYLHLDIKPSNFLVYPRPSEHIVLFDMDSVTSITDIENGVAKRISYSDDWAAPEQKQGKSDQLCPATDIFAIGAILFEKVMGRTVTAFDMGVFADWDLEGEMFDEVNPEIRVILKKVFKNTLAASAKRRYQATCELEEDLDRAIKILTAGEPYLLSEHISCTANFVGRQNELNAIEQAFASGSHIVCLKGMGGIGKSELARKYAQNYNSDETSAVFVSYRGKDSIEEMLDDIEIQNFTGSDKEKLKHLKKLLNKNVLLVVDELDSEDVPDLDILEGLKCRILLTSRLAWDEYGSFDTIPVSNLRDDEQVELFTREYGSDMSADEIAIIHEIFAMLEGHTLVISLLAKQMRKGLHSFEEVLQCIHSDGLKSVSDGKIRHMKDSSRPLSGTVYSILRTILNMADFSEDEIYVMRSLALIHPFRIERREFERWLEKGYTEIIDNLVFNGWIHLETKRKTPLIALHAVIAEMCYGELAPSITNCYGIRDQIWAFADEFARDHKNPWLGAFSEFVPVEIQAHVKYGLDYYVDLMRCILNRSDWSDAPNIIFWIRVIRRIANVMYGKFECFKDFLEYLIDIALDNDDFSLPYMAEAALALEKISLQNRDLESALVYAELVIHSLESVHNRDEIAFRACFSVYQYICCRHVEFAEYWKEPFFVELITFIKGIWENIVEHGNVESEDHDVWILSENGTEMSTEEAIEIAYKDFCRKISAEEKRDISSLIQDYYLDFASSGGTVVNDDLNVLLPDIPNTKDKASDNYLTDDECHLGHKAYMLERQVSAILTCEIFNVMGLWMAYHKDRTIEEKEGIRSGLQKIDPMLPYYHPSIDKKTVFVYNLAKMEAAFSYAYAIIEEWSKFSFHVENLMKYYEILIRARRYDILFKRTGMQDIKQLPGAASLLNQYGHVLPSELAADFISNMICIMERYHVSEHFGFESLFEVYQMALSFAKEANDSEKVAHFEGRIKWLSSVRFE